MTLKTAKAEITPIRKTAGVYRVWLSDRHYYVGRSVHIEGRCRGHLRQLQKGKHLNPYMQAVYAKYQAFRYEVVQELPPDMAEALEQDLINRHLGDDLCMNISPSAGYPTRKGKKNSPEHCARISSARKGMVFAPEARANMAAGQQKRFENGWSPELRTAMMEARSTPEHKARMSAAQRGKTVSDETRAKISSTLKGRVKTETTRAKLSTSLSGRSITAEARAKISAANRGGKMSDETRARMSEAQRRRQERERLDRVARTDGEKHG